MHKKTRVLADPTTPSSPGSVDATWAYTCACCLVLVRVIKGAGGGGTVVVVGAAMWALLTGELHNVGARENSTIGHVVSAVRSARSAASQQPGQHDWTGLDWIGLDSSGLAVRPLGDVILVQQTSSEQVSTVAPTPTRPIPQPPLGPMP